MTIPIQPVSIHPQFVPTQQPQTPGLELLLQALQHRQELEIAKKRLQREQEQFELNKKLAGPQLEGMLLENEQRKRQLKDAQDELAARDQALQLYTGNLSRLHDSQGIGEVIAGIKDPRVAQHFYEFIQQGTTTSQKSADLTRTETANTADVTTQRVLRAADLTTDRGQRQAIRDVLAQAGPDAASKLANTLNTGVGRYGHVIGPDGYLYITDSKTGAVRRDATVGQRQANQLLLQQVRTNAGLLVNLIDEQTKVIQDLGIGTSKNPTPAALLEGGRVLGISTEALSNWLRSDPQQLTRMLRTRFAHLYIGMLPHSRSAANLLQNLAESYWAPAGSGIPILQKAERDRRQLRAVLEGFQTGKITDMTRLPGFSAATAASAAEGNIVPGAEGAPTPKYPENPYP